RICVGVGGAIMLARRSLPFLILPLLLPAAASGSERSALLVAKGEVAYHRGRYEEARALFAEALAVDPDDVEARKDLGLALERLGRTEEAERLFGQAGGAEAEIAPLPAAPGAEGKPWSVYAGTGVGYDSNVTIAPSGDRLGGPKDDAVFT